MQDFNVSTLSGNNDLNLVNLRLGQLLCLHQMQENMQATEFAQPCETLHSASIFRIKDIAIHCECGLSVSQCFTMSGCHLLSLCNTNSLCHFIFFPFCISRFYSLDFLLYLCKFLFFLLLLQSCVCFILLSIKLYLCGYVWLFKIKTMVSLFVFLFCKYLTCILYWNNNCRSILYK